MHYLEKNTLKFYNAMNLKSLDNEDKMLIGAGILSLGVVGWWWWKTKKEKQADTPLLETPTTSNPVSNAPILATPPLIASPVSTAINKSMVLKRGSRGAEVKTLQRKLGIISDGIFGAITEDKLLKNKGVKQISLNAFEGRISTPSGASVPTTKVDVPYKKGQRLMVGVRTGFTAQRVQQKADGSYFTNGDNIFTLLGFGDEIGTIKSVLIRNDGLVRYVVDNKVMGLSRLLWLSHQNVQPIKN